MLRKIRLIAATLVIVLLTMLFLDFTGVLHKWFGWLAKIQLLPAILAVNTGVIVALVLLTLLFGRIYCSVICPLGTLQDGVSYLSAKRKGKKNRFTYSPAKTWLRYTVLVLFVIAFIAGVSAIVSILDPYSAYGRIASNIFVPVYRLGNNLLALFAEQVNSYAFYSTDVWVKSGITLGIAIITLVAVGVLAWRNGRTYCNTLCPVGTVLGLLSKFSLYRPTFNTDKCNGCGLCARNCKASCINHNTHTIDYSRCVTCMNCIEKCNRNAISYAPRKLFQSKKQEITNNETVESNDKNAASRRNFLSVTALLAMLTTVKAQELHVDGGLAEIEGKKVPDRKNRIVPPGAQSASDMNAKCTACQLCVSACPNNILRPSTKLETFMQPELSYERGYCRPECTECSQVCPTGAIQRITTADKSAIAIGRAFWIKENCVVNTDDVACTACQSHCPTAAITLVPRDANDSKSLQTPAIDNERCIGCGACEHLCPARPFSAIYVEGNSRHHAI